jgi:hypothetical protein
MGLETVVQQRHCLRGVLVQPLVVQRAQVDLAQRGDARGQLGPPLRIPALQQPASLVGVNRSRRVPDPSAQPRHHPHQQRQQPAGRWWPVPAAQRHQPGVLPAPEILELQALGQCPELGERLPDGPVAGLRQHRQQHRRQGLGGVAGLSLPEPGRHLDRYRDRRLGLVRQGGDGTRLQQDQLAAGQRPLDVLRCPEVFLDPAGQRGHRHRGLGVDRPSGSRGRWPGRRGPPIRQGTPGRRLAARPSPGPRSPPRWPDRRSPDRR